ncbi:MAG: hypothetical protein COA52_02445 [Hyphomicrobiales bacterium]|nr:MAG: hypothetical protein COA52_02445 [Hyphomicrobiales bacterium]
MNIRMAERIVSSFNSSEFSCPHCGENHDISDGEVAQQIISYWGDEVNEFTCGECNSDFVVKEIVCRSFETAKTLEELE